jgi:hypothetical protein
MSETQSTKVVTGKVRLSYVHLWEPYAMEEGQEKKYSTVLLIPKSDTATVKKIEAAIKVITDMAKAKNGGRLPKNFKNPLRDGDIEKPEDEAYAGHYFISASAKAQPGIVRKVGVGEEAKFVPITDQSAIYSGCYAIVSLNFFHYDMTVNKGVGCGLNNVLKAGDGEAFAGKATAEADFADLKDIDLESDEPATDDDDFLN